MSSYNYYYFYIETKEGNKMFCKHKWSVLSETVTKSKFESSLAALHLAGGGSMKLPHQMCCAERKHIQIVKCDKCGKLKRFTESI